MRQVVAVIVHICVPILSAAGSVTAVCPCIPHANVAISSFLSLLLRSFPLLTPILQIFIRCSPKLYLEVIADDFTDPYLLLSKRRSQSSHRPPPFSPLIVIGCVCQQVRYCLHWPSAVLIFCGAVQRFFCPFGRLFSPILPLDR